MAGDQTKFVFIFGGVMSGIGKGVTVASIGRILKNLGIRATAVKIDPYLNVDAGTMNPIEHGEVFVTEDGMECDQDIGNYERFLDENILKDNYMTSGLVYLTVIQKERNLEFGGKCVETVPHIPEEVIRRLNVAAHKTKAEVVIVEVGGTVGEYQNLVYLEAARMLKLQKPENILFVLVSYLPVPSSLGEMKTKPTQYAVRTLNTAGIQPDIIIARASSPIDAIRKKKISIFCSVKPEDVISAPDVSNIYEIPVNFEKDKISLRLIEKLGIKPKSKNGRAWQKLIENIKKSAKPVKIGIVGKYFASGSYTLKDSYISVIEAVKHAAWSLGRKPEIVWLNAEDYEKDSKSLKELESYHGVIVPGGFGTRGTEGKIKAIEYLRNHNIPFLGLCYGLQMAVIDYARNVCKLKGAHSTEIDPAAPHPVISTIPDQAVNISKKDMGGTMRLGSYACELKNGTFARKLYNTKVVLERHRHRYEVNNDYVSALEKNGLVVSGTNPKTNLVEIIELPKHKFFLATQFHPEFKSRPLSPHPLFKGFIEKAIQ
ncbi:MAG: CTP synthetase [Parcubacteria group bacterium Licking1014_17]|nr:MAG: CTP synthetase [Parcubacteria group bacterium Licking1014_17]